MKGPRKVPPLVIIGAPAELGEAEFVRHVQAQVADWAKGFWRAGPRAGRLEVSISYVPGEVSVRR